MCVCFLFIYSGRQACGRTSRGDTGFLTHLASAVLALNFLARGGFSRSFPCLPAVESNYVYYRFNRSPLLGHICKKYLFFSYTGIRTHVPTSEGFEVIIPTEPPGRPACVIKTFRWGLLVHATKLCPFARAYGKHGNRKYAH